MSAIEARETRLHLTTGAWAWIAVGAALLLFVRVDRGMVDPKNIAYHDLHRPLRADGHGARPAACRRCGRGSSPACSTR